MTDDAINRLVAERVLGMTVDGRLWERSDGAYLLHRNFCTDPAAWGALLEHIARERLMPKLRWDEVDAQWVAQVGRDVRYEMGRDALPGRALALAALRAYGVEVPDGHP